MKPPPSRLTAEVKLWPATIGVAAGVAACGFAVDWLGLAAHSYLAFPGWLVAIALGGVGGGAMGLLVASPRPVD